MLPDLPGADPPATDRRTLLMRRREAGRVRPARAGHPPRHVHPPIGQEAIGLPAAAHLAPGDHVATAHRNRGHLLAWGAEPRRPPAEIPEATADAVGARKRRRPCLRDLARGYEDTPVYDGSKLAAGHELLGPAVIEERTTTVVIPAWFTCRVDRWRNYILTRRARPSLLSPLPAPSLGVRSPCEPSAM